jgi:hypothetical protein
MFVLLKKVFPFVNHTDNQYTLFYTLKILRKKLFISELKSFST